MAGLIFIKNGAWFNVRMRVIEDVLLKGIIRAEHIPDDMPILPEYRVPMRILNDSYNDFGVQLEVTETERDRGAYHIEPALQDWAEMKKLHFRKEIKPPLE